ncbi:hypothetical protein CLOACE_07530 [Clostridium acetireducens DSM 10703]|uniref:DUF3153 domain-containing protein n=1 Tax=Clostridium acetireducens DSM 10703 TaxID=1121290 RepID=A0A1E8F0T9_9CLOT|nr:hypothetical protein [Clostridium acetireducens]OFI06770.1 hypothetical protein CLOACE_07530 [Clostridium acetireducens DSM 10703]
MRIFKHWALIFTLLLCFTITGCGTLNVGTKTVINNKGAGTITFKISSEGIYEQVLSGNENNNNLFNLKNKNIQKKAFKEGEKSIEEYTLKFNNIKEFNDLFKDVKKDEIKIEIKENKSLFKITYQYKLYLPKGFSLDELSKEALNNNKAGQPQDLEIVSPEQVKAFLGSSIVFSNEIVVPGKVEVTNAVSTSASNNVNTLKWSYSLSQINPNNPLIATYSISNKTNIALVSGISIVAVAAIAFIILKKKK